MPAAAQYSTEVVPPKILKIGTHTSPVAGTGSVRVQVQLNANGTHVVTRIISSTNHGDDAAAREIAQTSTYRPATRGGRAIVYFYDPVFRFTGKSVAGYQEPSVGASGGGGSATAALGAGGGTIDQMLRAGRYAAAKSAAEAAVARNPGDVQALEQLGAADYYLHDEAGAADAFARAGTFSALYRPVAASAFTNAAVALASTDPAKSLEYARRGVALEDDTNARFALGVAQLANKQYAQALTTLQAVRAAAFASSKTTVTVKYAIDERIQAAYVGMGNVQGAQQVGNEMARLEPNNASAQENLGAELIQQGDAAATAKNYDQAMSLYQRAAAAGDSRIQVLAYDRMARTVASEPNASSADNVTLLKADADKALALNPNDAAANFFEGLALYYQYQTSHNASTKQQALTYLTKADGEAKQDSMDQLLVQSIENLMKQINNGG